MLYALYSISSMKFHTYRLTGIILEVLAALKMSFSQTRGPPEKVRGHIFMWGQFIVAILWSLWVITGSQLLPRHWLFCFQLRRCSSTPALLLCLCVCLSVCLWLKLNFSLFTCISMHQHASICINMPPILRSSDSAQVWNFSAPGAKPNPVNQALMRTNVK